MEDREEVYDLAQVTFIQAFKSISRYDASRSLAAWLRGIALNCVKKHFRSLNRRRKREQAVFEDRLLNWQIGPADSEDRLQALAGCLKELEGRSRELIDARYVGNKAVQVLAQEYGKTPDALGKQLMRIRTVLARCIKNRVENGA